MHCCPFRQKNLLNILWSKTCGSFQTMVSINSFACWCTGFNKVFQRLKKILFDTQLLCRMPKYHIDDCYFGSCDAINYNYETRKHLCIQIFHQLYHCTQIPSLFYNTYLKTNLILIKIMLMLLIFSVIQTMMSLNYSIIPNILI